MSILVTSAIFAQSSHVYFLADFDIGSPGINVDPSSSSKDLAHDQKFSANAGEIRAKGTRPNPCGSVNIHPFTIAFHSTIHFAQWIPVFLPTSKTTPSHHPYTIKNLQGNVPRNSSPLGVGLNILLAVRCSAILPTSQSASHCLVHSV